MSILIKGMEMPKETVIHVAIGGGIASVKIGDGRTDYYYAIEIPSHGDLIDRGTLEQDAQKRLLICNKNDNQFQKPYEVMRAIALAPTIIEAEV